jgi:hypothetical protein
MRNFQLSRRPSNQPWQREIFRNSQWNRNIVLNQTKIGFILRLVQALSCQNFKQDHFFEWNLSGSIWLGQFWTQFAMMQNVDKKFKVDKKFQVFLSL